MISALALGIALPIFGCATCPCLGSQRPDATPLRTQGRPRSVQVAHAQRRHLLRAQSFGRDRAQPLALAQLVTADAALAATTMRWAAQPTLVTIVNMFVGPMSVLLNCQQCICCLVSEVGKVVCNRLPRLAPPAGTKTTVWHLQGVAFHVSLVIWAPESRDYMSGHISGASSL